MSRTVKATIARRQEPLALGSRGPTGILVCLATALSLIGTYCASIGFASQHAPAEGKNNWTLVAATNSPTWDDIAEDPVNSFSDVISEPTPTDRSSPSFVPPPLSSIEAEFDLGAKPAKELEIETLDGRKFHRARISKVTHDVLHVEYPIEGGGIGFATIKAQNLPAELRRKYFPQVELETEKLIRLRREAERGNPTAQADLGNYYFLHNHGEAERWFRKAAEQGHAEGQNGMGVSYALGFGVPKDSAEAVRWFLKAAEQEHAGAQFNLGQQYAEGDGVEKNLIQAAYWFRKAAEQGDVGGQYQLGLCLIRGEGVTQDFVEAHKWLNLAAAKGFSPALEVRRALEPRMSALQLAEAQRRAALFSPKTSQKEEVRPRDEPFSDLLSCGSGFLVTEDGYALTAFHVVRNARRISLRTKDGMSVAKLVKTDPVNDLALLKASGDFHALPLQPSGDVQLGESVLTVGFPNVSFQGVAPKLTEGRISSLSGVADDPRNFQISVPVQPGNSGGALVNLRGNVVGIVVARLDDLATLTESGSLPQNVNYAVKSAYVFPLLESIPGMTAKLKKPMKEQRSVEDVTKLTERATVMVLAH